MVDLAERMFQEIVGFERRVTGQDLRPSGELRITASDVLLRHLLSAVFIAINLVAVFHTIRHALPAMKQSNASTHSLQGIRRRWTRTTTLSCMHTPSRRRW